MNVISWFQNLPFKFNLHHYTEVMTLRWRREGDGGGDDDSEGEDDGEMYDDDDVDPNAVRVVDVLGMTPDADGSISLQVGLALPTTFHSVILLQSKHGSADDSQCGPRIPI